MNPRLAILAKTALVTAAAFSLFSVYSRNVPYSLVWNRTPSIPMGLYWAEDVSAAQLQRGELACFPYAAPAWAQERKYLPEGVSVCKPVAGLPGDVVRHVGNELFVAHDGRTQRLGQYTAFDSAHRPLPQDVLADGPVPDGSLLMVAGAHDNSLDSRYIGLIPASHIQRRIHPLYTW